MKISFKELKNLVKSRLQMMMENMESSDINDVDIFMPEEKPLIMGEDPMPEQEEEMGGLSGEIPEEPSFNDLSTDNEQPLESQESSVSTLDVFMDDSQFEQYIDKEMQKAGL